MPRDWESVFNTWAQPPGETERAKQDNAVAAIRKAIDASEALARRSITVSLQGSYRNNTTGRQDSDVDVGILCRDTFHRDLPEGVTDADLGLVGATYIYDQYKNEVELALSSYFGRTSVTRGNKAFDVHANTYRVDADVVACFEHRRYISKTSYREGVAFQPDNGAGSWIVNWPEQNYKNGVEKNNETARAFKGLVRIFKKLRNEMQESYVSESTPMASFLLESLAWNVPNGDLCHSTHRDDVKSALAYLYQHTSSEDACHEWGEINELKYLFRPVQRWTREQVNQFCARAWTYIGFP